MQTLFALLSLVNFGLICYALHQIRVTNRLLTQLGSRQELATPSRDRR